jgi:hypothetical protein
MLREEHRLRMFGNRVLRKMFGLKRNEMAGGWRKLHDNKLYNLYYLPSIIRLIKSRWMVHVAYMEKNVCRIFNLKARKKDTTSKM